MTFDFGRICFFFEVVDVERRSFDPDRSDAHGQRRDQAGHSDQSGLVQSDTSSEQRKRQRTQNSENGRNCDQTSDDRFGDALPQAVAVGDVVEAKDRHVEEGQAEAGVSGRMSHVGEPGLQAVGHAGPDVLGE